MRRIFLATFSTALFLCLGIQAEEKPLTPEEEEKLAAKEDAESEANMVLGQKTSFTGTVSLDDAKKEFAPGTVLGSFAVKEGKIYPMKAASEAVFTQLKAANGKLAIVSGKLRVNGKYLIVMAVLLNPSEAGQRDKRKKGGL